MSVSDPLILACKPDWAPASWYLLRGSETFYYREQDPDCTPDNLNTMRRWQSSEAAIHWAQEELGESPLEHLPEEARERAESRYRERIKQARQERLF